MQQLDYKGWRGTRLQLLVCLVLMVTAGYIWGDVTAQQWVDFLLYTAGTYGITEVGAKGAAAYRDRGGSDA